MFETFIKSYVENQGDIILDLLLLNRNTRNIEWKIELVLDISSLEVKGDS